MSKPGAASVIAAKSMEFVSSNVCLRSASHSVRFSGVLFDFLISSNPRAFTSWRDLSGAAPPLNY